MAKSRNLRYVGLAVIAIPMLLYGASSFEATPESEPMVKVGDHVFTLAELNVRAAQELESLREVYGDLVDDPATKTGVERRIILGQAQRLLLLSRAEELGLSPSDLEVVNSVQGNEQFHVDGSFSSSRFNALVGEPQLYLRQVREDLKTDKIRETFLDSAIVTETPLEKLARFADETRKVRKIEFPVDFASVNAEITDEQASAYYEENVSEYTLPAEIRYEYIHLTPDLFEDQIEIDEELLREAHEARSSRARELEERQLSVITVGSEEEAVALLDGAREGAERFAELAREHSVDAGSSAAGGDLGFLTREDLDEQVAQEVFAAEVGSVVGPLESGGSWLLVRVAGLIGGDTSSFEEAREDLVEDVRADELALIVSEQATLLQELSLENVDNLAVVAAEMGLELQESPKLTLDNLDDLAAPFNEQEIMQELLNQDLLENGINSPLLLRSDGSYLVARVVEFQPVEVQALDEVRDDVDEQVRRQLATDQKVSEVTGWVSSLLAGQEAEQLAFDSQPSVEVNQVSNESELSEQEVAALFDHSSLNTDGSLPAYAVRYDPENEVVVAYRIDEIVNGGADEEFVQLLVDNQALFDADLLLTGYFGELESAYGIAFGVPPEPEG